MIKHSFAFFIVLFNVSVVFAQTQRVDTSRAPVFVYVEQMPEFLGGDAALVKYLQDHVSYPDSAREHGVSGRVIVSFVVTDDGHVKDAQVMRGVSLDIDAEALRVVNAMPLWHPGKQNGRNVNVRYNIPITFSLSDH